MLAFKDSRDPFLNNLRLKSEVLNHMQADRIAFIAKADPIICVYAEDYLRKHNKPSVKNAVSNKVREMGRLLQTLQETYGIQSVIDMLKPENFDTVVSASRVITGYDSVTLTFTSPSLALHLKGILLSICSTAETLLLKKSPTLQVENYGQTLKEVREFRQLVDENWKFEMGSLALKDLNQKRNQRPQSLPLTSDILLFKDYTFKAAENAVRSLNANKEDKQSFKILTETTLALTILLNRKRVGDVQYMKLKEYNAVSTNNDQQECLSVLTESEKQLSKYFKRIITLGKGNKSVAVLFSKDLQRLIDKLLEVRNTTEFVPNNNPYLFALVGSSVKWVDGSFALRKYASASGCKNKSTITSSRLRKQIATVLQILNLNSTEMEQVATFMGHTKKTHEKFYRLVLITLICIIPAYACLPLFKRYS